METTTEIRSLVSLWDDPDQVVRQAVWKRIREMGPTALEQLKEMAHQADRSTRFGLVSLLEQLYRSTAMDDLYKWLENPMDNTLRGLCLVQEAAGYPIDCAWTDEVISDGANEVNAELSDNCTLLESVQLFNHVFYHRLGFQAADPFIKEVRYAFIDKVLEQHTGNPVTLGIIYMLMAYRCNVPIKGVAFKGGFLPAVTDKNGEVVFYVNIYKDGSLFAPSQLDYFLKESGLTIPKESFRAASPVDMAQMYAECLYYLFTTQEDATAHDAEQRMEHVLKCFGEERTLLAEEDDEEE